MALPSYQIELIENEYIADNVRKLIFKLVEPATIRYRPGQFVSLMFEIEGKIPFKRSYSLANLESPNEDGLAESDRIEIVVSYVDNGRATNILFNAKTGDTFTANGPVGMLVLGANLPKRIFLVGTGTGMAPYHGMLPQIEKMPNHEFVILFGAQKYSDSFYLEDFQKAAQANNIDFHLCLSREEHSEHHSGYVQTKLQDFGLNPETDKVYLCGNPNMVDDISATLLEQGFGVKQVQKEKYIFSRT